MKKQVYSLLMLCFLCLDFAHQPHPAAAQQNPNITTSYTIQRKGMTYEAARFNGSILMPSTQTNGYFMLSADFMAHGKNITLAIYLRNQDDLIVGKIYSLAGNGNLENDSKKPRTVLYVEFERNGDESKTVTSGSESGTFVFSSISISGKTAIVSGRFAFKGLNSNDHQDADSEISVKGSFTNATIRCIIPKKTRQQW